MSIKSINFDRADNCQLQPLLTKSPITFADLRSKQVFMRACLAGLTSMLGIVAFGFMPGVVRSVAAQSLGSVAELSHPRSSVITTKTKQAFTGLPIVVAVMAKVPPEKDAEFMAIATKTKELALNDTGVLSYDFYKQHNSDDLYLIFIEVVSRKALNQHLETNHAQEFIAQLDRIVSEPISSRIYTIRGTDFVLGF
jgi:quinol monooxygenase YgiN